MTTYLLCPHCGNSYDVEEPWVAQEHFNQNCTNYHAGLCETCDGNMGEMSSTPTGGTRHKDMRDCIHTMKEQVQYMEQYRLEHDTRYCELEKDMKDMRASVDALAEGRKAALDESRYLKALRNTDAPLQD